MSFLRRDLYAEKNVCEDTNVGGPPTSFYNSKFIIPEGDSDPSVSTDSIGNCNPYLSSIYNSTFKTYNSRREALSINL